MGSKGFYGFNSFLRVLKGSTGSTSSPRLEMLCFLASSTLVGPGPIALIEYKLKNSAKRDTPTVGVVIIRGGCIT